MDALVQKWSDEYPHVGYSIVEEMAYQLLNASTTNINASSAPSCPTELEIESFLAQMNSLNARQSSTIGGPSSSSVCRRSATGNSSINRSRGTDDEGGAANSNQFGDDEDDDDLTSSKDHLIVFTSTITSSRRVRDDDRHIRNLFHLLKLPYEEMNVADNKFIQNEVVRRVQNALRGTEAGGAAYKARLPASAADLMPHIDSPSALLEHCLPIVFYDQKLIGMYADIQYFVDDEPKHATLQRVLAEVGSSLKVS